MIDPANLDRWFKYHAPTEETAPKYAAIRDAETACWARVAEAMHSNRMRAPEAFEEVNAATRAFADVINEQAPDSADKTAAIRCLRLARNGANEFIALRAQHGLKMAASVVATLDNLEGGVLRELRNARWQSCAAVACDGK